MIYPKCPNMLMLKAKLLVFAW